MAVWYLDSEDEITDAVARLRDTDDEQVVFVVPPGSRIATGRINFKLLAREARSRELSMAVASPDEQVRAMASSAGVLACVTPDEAKAALERGDEPASEPASAPAAAPVQAAATDAETASGGRVLAWRSQRVRITAVVLLAVVIVAGFVTSQAIPTAEITLTPRLVALGPVELTIAASTETEVADPATGTIPAVTLPIELKVDDAYAASGTEATETYAEGEVVFSSSDQEFDQEIAAGTRVRTPAGIEFETTDSVILPRGEGSGRATVRAPVRALAGGEAGNVPAGTISVVPSLESQGIDVTNPEPTNGGRVLVRPLITAADYDAAAVDLRNRLTGALAAHLRDPANVPTGLTVFAETATLGQVALEPAATEVVGSATETFSLAGSAVARVLAVDESLIDEVSRERLVASVPAAMRLLAESVTAGHGEGTVEGDRIRFEASARGTVTPVIEREALLAEVAGLPVSEAQAILERLGAATVSVWPGFMGDLPNDRERITLDVTEASATE